MKIEHVTVESLMAESKGEFNKRIAKYAKDHDMKLGEAERYLIAFALGRKSSLAVDRAKRAKGKTKSKAKKSAKTKAKSKSKPAAKTAKRAKRPAKKPAAKPKAKAAPKAKKASKPRPRKVKSPANGASETSPSSLGDTIAEPMES